MATTLAQVRAFYDERVEGLRLDHPEGVAVGPDGSVWAGGEAGQIYRIDPDGGHARIVADTGGFVLGLTFDRAGNLYCCDQDHQALLRLSAGAEGDLEVVAHGVDGHPLRIPNACVCDGRGRIYVTDSHGSDDPGPGVFRFDPDGGGELWYGQPMRFANGVALSNDGATLYVAESFLPGVTAIPIVDDRAGEPRTLAQLPGTVPDGLLVGPDDAVYVGCYEPSSILRIGPDGEVTTVVHDPTAHLLCHPTNLARRGDLLFAANLGRWHVTVVDPAPWVDDPEATT